MLFVPSWKFENQSIAQCQLSAHHQWFNWHHTLVQLVVAPSYQSLQLTEIRGFKFPNKKTGLYWLSFSVFRRQNPKSVG